MSALRPGVNLTADQPGVCVLWSGAPGRQIRVTMGDGFERILPDEAFAMHAFNDCPVRVENLSWVDDHEGIINTPIRPLGRVIVARAGVVTMTEVRQSDREMWL